MLCSPGGRRTLHLAQAGAYKSNFGPGHTVSWEASTATSTNMSGALSPAYSCPAYNAPDCRSTETDKITLKCISRDRQSQSHHQLPTVMLSNTRALTNKIDEVEGILKHNNVDVAAVVEIWMSPRIPVECTHISGYNVFHKLRKEGRC